MSAAALTEVESTEARAGGLPRRVGALRGAFCSVAAALLLHPRDSPVKGGPAALRIGVAGAAALPRHEADEVVEPEGEEPQQLDDEEPHGPDDDPKERLAEDHLEHDEDAERDDGPAEVATRGAVVPIARDAREGERGEADVEGRQGGLRRPRRQEVPERPRGLRVGVPGDRQQNCGHVHVGAPYLSRVFWPPLYTVSPEARPAFVFPLPAVAPD